MFAYHHEHPDLKVRAWFVHDYCTEEWTRGEPAFYVISQDVRSPMGTGVAAFAQRPAACGGGSPAPAATTAPAEAQKFADLKGNAENGKIKFAGTCVSCHGPDAKGMPAWART